MIEKLLAVAVPIRVERNVLISTSQNFDIALLPVGLDVVEAGQHRGRGLRAHVGVGVLAASADRHPELCRAMTEIVGEELEHFHMVLDLLAAIAVVRLALRRNFPPNI